MDQDAAPSTTRFAPLAHIPAYKALSDAIEQRIVSGELPSGALLPTETLLAQQFQVHRSTVREAIRQLEQEGFVVRGAGRRLQVALPGVRELGSRTGRALLLQQVTYRELWEVAEQLEPLAARLAALHRTDADLAQLEAILADAQRDIGDRISTSRLDVDFHAGVAAASKNRVLILAREPVNLLFRASIGQLQIALPVAASRNLDAHRKMLNAIRSGDAAEAELWARRHLRDFHRGFELARIDLDGIVPKPD